MLSSIVKDHQVKQQERKETQELKRKEAIRASNDLTQALVDHLNVGVAQAYLNQKRLDTEAKHLHHNATNFAKQTQQWLQLVSNFSSALKEIGDVENWAKSIEADMRTVSSSLEYAYKVQYPRYVRVNLLKTTEENVIQCFENEGWVKLETASTYEAYLRQLKTLSGSSNFIQDFHFSEMLAFPANTNFHRHRLLEDNFIILHSKSSCIPVKLLNPRPGSIILDMCAAPGIKTSLLAAHINNNGEIHAVEKSMNRFATMNRLLQQFGATCVKTYNTDVLQMKLVDKIPGVTHILVDPSCSGSGMERPEMQEEKPEEQVKSLSTFQFRALVKALWYPSVRRVVYSTCSLNPLENEAVVRDAINFTGHTFKVVDAWPATKGEFKRGSAEYPGGELCLYVIPEKDFCTGFFIAVLERNSKKNRKRKDGDQENEDNYQSVETSMYANKYGDSILEQLEDEGLHSEYKKNKKQKVLPEVEQERLLEFETESHYNEKRHKKILKMSQDASNVEIDSEVEPHADGESSKKYKLKKSSVFEPEQFENKAHVDDRKQKRKKTEESENTSSIDKFVTELDESQEESKPHKKSKKKKKQKVDDEHERELETATDSNEGKCRRKEKLLDEEINIIESDDAIPHKKSKKGKQSQDVHDGEHNQEADTCSNEQNKKKKKKMKEAQDISSMDPALELEPLEGDDTNKKSKKKKQKVKSNDEQEKELEAEAEVCLQKRKSQDIPSMESDLESAPQEANKKSKKRKQKVKTNDEQEKELEAEAEGKKKRKSQDIPSMESDLESAPQEANKKSKKKKQKVKSNDEQEKELEAEDKGKKKRKSQDVPSTESDLEIAPQEAELSNKKSKKKKQKVKSNDEQEKELETEDKVKKKRKSQDVLSTECDLEIAPQEAELSNKKSKKKKQKIMSVDEEVLEIEADSCSSEKEHKRKKKTKEAQDLPSMQFDCDSEVISTKRKKQKVTSDNEQEGELVTATDSCSSERKRKRKIDELKSLEKATAMEPELSTQSN